MNDADTLTAPPETDLPIEEFIARGNAIERGEDPPAIEVPEEEAPAAPVEESPAVVEEPGAAEPEQPAPVEEAPPKSKKDAIERMLKATAREAEAKREAAAERKRAESLEKELAAARSAAPAPRVEPIATPEPTADDWERFAKHPNAPKREAFGSDEAYGAAVWNFTTRQMVREEFEARSVEQSAIQQHEAWIKRVADARKSDPALDAKMADEASLKAIAATRQMGDFMKRSTSGVSVLKYFLDNPSDARRIAALHPLSQAEELARIEARLEAAPRITTGPAPVVIDKIAKPPLKPVSGSPNISTEVDDGDLSVEEHIRRGNKRDGIALPRQLRR